MSNRGFFQTLESYEAEFPLMGGVAKAVKSNFEPEGEPEAEGSVPVLGAGARVQVPKEDGSMAQVNISEYIWIYLNISEYIYFEYIWMS